MATGQGCGDEARSTEHGGSVLASRPPLRCLKNRRIPDSQVASTTLASLTTVPCSKTRPKIIVSIIGSADGFRDTDRGRHPAGQAFRFLYRYCRNPFSSLFASRRGPWFQIRGLASDYRPHVSPHPFPVRLSAWHPLLHAHLYPGHHRLAGRGVSVAAPPLVTCGSDG